MTRHGRLGIASPHWKELTQGHFKTQCVSRISADKDGNEEASSKEPAVKPA